MSLQRHFSQPNAKHSTEETTPNTVRADEYQ